MFEDNQLQHAVIAELFWEPSVDSARIGVTAHDGIVTLTGLVESYAQKHAAETAANRVRGVRAVAADIDVQIPFERQRSDADLAAAVLERLAWDVAIPDGAVGVTVEKGFVTLTGEVAWHYQREAAEQNVRRLHGVKGLANQMTIKSGVDVANISNDITAALHRSWFPDPDAILVTARDGKVKLTGNVHSWHARQVAGETAWGAPGITDVENLLAVI
jgi:osmotically-inducible protein OsmY